MDTTESKPLFTLSVAAEIIGVHPRTLMIYEKEDETEVKRELACVAGVCDVA